MPTAAASMSVFIRPIDLDQLRLGAGSHTHPSEGMCVLEAAAYFAGEPHTDHPACVSPLLGKFLRTWCDTVDSVFRQRLKPYAPRIIGTAYDNRDQERNGMCTDWLVRTCIPAWLDASGLSSEAAQLRGARAAIDEHGAFHVMPRLDAAETAMQILDYPPYYPPGWYSIAGACGALAAGHATYGMYDQPYQYLARRTGNRIAWAVIGYAAKSISPDRIRATVSTIQQSALQLVDRMIA